jgi:carbonic anhydrase/acetyltransferase-like protein (isoleucine patch superfamily)
MPRIHPSVYIAEGALVIGDVEIGADASIWFHAILRGDINGIRIGERTNVQDGSVLHVTHEYMVVLGSDITVGHRAILHGCTVHEECLIGMGSIVLDNARVGPSAMVAAGAVVRENFVVPEGTLAAGVPARIIRDLTPEERELLRASAGRYVTYARTYRS